MKFIFYYGQDESEYEFEDDRHLDDVSSEFDSWLFHIFGIGVDKSEELIESGQAGYYKVDKD